MLHTFIGRKKYITEFKAYLAMATSEEIGEELIQGDLIRYSGQSGIGKSTLLRRLSEECDHQEKPYCWLDIDGLELPSGQDILFELARSSRQFPAAQKIALEKNNQKTSNNDELTLVEQINYQEDTIKTILSALKTFDPMPNAALTNLLGAGIDWTRGVLNRKADQVEQDVLRNSELFLLNILKNTGKKRPVIFFDGYEHLYRQNQTITSRIQFAGDTVREWSNKQTPRAQWIQSLASFLQQNGWIVVMAGRTYIDDKNIIVLERFSYVEITEAVELKAEQEEMFANLINNSESKEKLIQLLSELSFEGNPLWLLIAMNLVENLLVQGDTLDKLQSDPDYLQDCFEAKPLDDLEEFGEIEHSTCKLNLLNQLTPDDPSLEIQAWKLAIPRIFDERILKLLFKDDAGKITKAYRLVGAFSERGKQYKLHEEIRDLLLAYARSKNLLDTASTRKIHQQLFKYLLCWHNFDLQTLKIQARKKRSQTEKLEHNKQNSWMLEASYHGVMRDAICTRNGVTPTEFWEYLGHSISLSYLEKLAFAVNNLSNNQMHKLISKLKDEKIKAKKILGEKVVIALSKALATGKALNIYDLSYWQEKIKQTTAEAGDYLGLAVAYSAHAFTEEEIRTYNELIKRYGSSDVRAVQEHCAMALLSKGVTQGELGQSEEAINTYDELIKRYGSSDVRVVQERCAMALYNKGIRQGELGQSEEAINTYDELIKCYGSSDIMAVQEHCAMALYNKGFRQGEQGQSEEEIKTYDELIIRYGNSDALDLQKLCTRALYYKGITLGELGQSEEAIKTFDELIKYYGGSIVLAVQEYCAMALCDKGIEQEQLEQSEEAINTYNELLKRYGNNDALELQEQCAKALVNKGFSQEQQEQYEEAIKTFDELIKCYGSSDVLAVQEYCAMALLSKGVRQKKLEQSEEAIKTYNELIKRYGTSENSKY